VWRTGLFVGTSADDCTRICGTAEYLGLLRDIWFSPLIAWYLVTLNISEKLPFPARGEEINLISIKKLQGTHCKVEKKPAEGFPGVEKETVDHDFS
jgi:hypothetical protein